MFISLVKLCLNAVVIPYHGNWSTLGGWGWGDGLGFFSPLVSFSFLKKKSQHKDSKWLIFAALEDLNTSNPQTSLTHGEDLNDKSLKIWRFQSSLGKCSFI